MQVFKSLFAVLGVAGPAAIATAGVVVDISEVNDDVVMSGSGSLDVSLWTIEAPGGHIPGVGAQIGPNVGPFNGDIEVYVSPVNFQGPAAIGSGTGFFTGDGTGTNFGIDVSRPSLVLPEDYIDNTPLAATALVEDESFATIGLTPGSYTWTWDTASGGSDFFTVNVAAVPEPTSLALLSISAVALLRRRRT